MQTVRLETNKSVLRVVLQGPGSRYTAAVIELDLTKAGSLVERMQEALALFGRVDILINNAGMITYTLCGA